MNSEIPANIKKLYQRFDKCSRCRQEKNPLLHILGGGKFIKPRFCFVFINPTHLNLSSHQDYQGQRRFPFIGVRYFYRLLAEAGFADQKIVDNIYQRGWQIEDEDKVEQSLARNNVYITNIVKCTQAHPESPTKEFISQDFSLFSQEIKLVSPKYIVAFGKLVIKTLTKQDVRLNNYLEAKSYQSLESVKIVNKVYPVLPCFFPVGRGNPKKAIKILSYIKKNFN